MLENLPEDALGSLRVHLETVSIQSLSEPELNLAIVGRVENIENENKSMG